MKTYLSFLLSMLALTVLTGCGSSTKTATLEVSQAFATTNGTFGGGLLIHAVSNSGKNFTIAIKSGLSRKVTLETDTWTFYAIGYDGGPAPEKEFTGTAYCGKVIQDLSSNATVNINISTLTCGDPTFMAETGLKDLYTLSCGSFNEYNISDNTFSAITASSTDNFCDSLPIGMRGEMKYMRYVALDSFGSLKKQVFKSPCLLLTNANQRKLPHEKFALEIETYRSLPECMVETNKHLSFEFLKGINQGRPLDFNQKIDALTSPDRSRLILPAKITKRGNSPFIVNATNMIPRVLCGNSSTPALVDCIPDNADGYHIDVPFYSPANSKKDQLIFKSTKATTVPPGFFANSKFFNLSDAYIDDHGDLRGNIQRNQLTCQPSTSPAIFTNIIDMYYNAGLVYILRATGGNDFVTILTVKGRFILDHDLGSTGFSKIAARTNGTSTYLYFAYGNFLKVKEYNGTTFGAFSSTDIGSPNGAIEDLEVTQNGFVYASRAGSVITVFDHPNSNIVEQFSSGSVTKIKLMGTGLLYALNSSPAIDRYYINTTTGVLTYNATVTSTITGAANFDISGTKVNIEKSDGDFISMDYSAASSFSNLQNHTSGYSYFDSFFMYGGKIYVSSSSELRVVEISGSIAAYSAHVTVCDETSLSLQPDGLDLAKTITIKSNAVSSYPIFDEGMNVFGQTTTAYEDEHYYLFRNLQDNKDEITGGGKLRKVQEQLTTGVATIIPENTCTDLYNNLTTPRTINRIIDDPFDGNFLVSVSLARSSAIIPDYICVDGNPAFSSCADTYDISLEWTTQSLGVIDEKGRIHLKCNRALGTLETVELDGSKQSRELTVWNTGEMEYARFENYNLDFESSTVYRSEITTLEKTGIYFGFNARTISIDTNAGNTFGNASEIEGDGTLTYVMRKSLEDSSLSNFFGRSDTPFSTNRNLASFNALSADQGMNYNQTSFYMGNSGGTFSDSRSTDSNGLSLSIATFEDLGTDINHPVRLMFTLTAP